MRSSKPIFIHPCVICVGANFYGASVGHHAGVTDPLTYGQINAGGVRLNLTDIFDHKQLSAMH